MINEIYICDLEEVVEGRYLMREIEGKSIGCTLANGRIICLLNYCPHEGAEICRGHIGLLVKKGCVGSFDYDPTKKVAVCPWHKWEFCLETGEPVVHGAGKLKLFAHNVRDNKVYVLL